MSQFARINCYCIFNVLYFWVFLVIVCMEWDVKISSCLFIRAWSNIPSLFYLLTAALHIIYLTDVWAVTECHSCDANLEKKLWPGAAFLWILCLRVNSRTEHICALSVQQPAFLFCFQQCSWVKFSTALTTSVTALYFAPHAGSAA